MQTPITFSTKLRRAMDAHGVSSRALARQVDPSRPESTRRAIMRYLAGTTVPAAPMRFALADALGVPREELADDSDEADPVAELVRAVEKFARYVVATSDRSALAAFEIATAA